MAKKSSLIVATPNDDNSAVTIVVNGVGEFELTAENLSPEIWARAAIHGLVQKVSDAAAISRDELSGDPAIDARLKYDAMAVVVERLKAGDWKKPAGDGAGPVSGIIYRAFEEWVVSMAKAKKTAAPSPDAIRAAYDGKDRAGQLALRNVPAIAAIIDRIKSERGAASGKTVDTDALLGELGI